jgi:NSS family neurotransmitter:Na+ symporter
LPDQKEDAASQKWSTNLLFLIAAVGAEAGVASVWKFSYLAGTNGGGLFVFAYALALLLIAVPALMAEMLIGRRGNGSMIGTLRNLVNRGSIAPPWIALGYTAFLCLVLTISYYYIICGWMLEYLRLALGGAFRNIDAAGANRLFTDMLASPIRMLINSGLIIAASALVVATGLHRGIERISMVLTPMRFAVLLLLVFFAIITADAGEAARFLFKIDFARFSIDSVIAAVGQAFFSLGVGLGVMMTVGAYMKVEYSLPKSAAIIGFSQLVVALMAGMTIFPFVFSANIPPAEGPGLLFVVFPVALSQMPLGALVGVGFFLLMSFAALTATAIMLEAIVAVLRDFVRLPKWALVWMAAFAIWAMGALTALSFNAWHDIHPLSWFGIASAKTPFDLLDYLTSNIMMPLGGLCISLLLGWGIPAAAVADELKLDPREKQVRIFRFLTRWVIPLVVITLFLLMI